MSKRATPCQALGWLAVTGVLLSGCAGLYFHTVEGPPLPIRHTLADWPTPEYWTGLIFNGEKIGFTHLTVIPPHNPDGLFEIQTEALLRFTVLGFEKQVTLTARDWITADLRLVRFVYDYNLDGRGLALRGRVEGDRLVVERVRRGNPGDDDERSRNTTEELVLSEPVYPASVIALYPTIHGLQVGRAYSYLVYDGQRQDLARVTQEVGAYQESELYDGRAFEVETSMDGQDSTLWINAHGEPVLEMAFHGILISTLEGERIAMGYLARASLNKQETVLDYSRIRINVAIASPRDIARMHIHVGGMPDGFVLPSDAHQRCDAAAANPQHATTCVITGKEKRHGDDPGVPPPAGLTEYLIPTRAIDSHDPDIRATAQTILNGTADVTEQIGKLVGWLQKHVTQKPVDVFTARDVFERREAECQGLTLLYSALARSVGIPTRVTNGVVYLAELDGFLYHTWAESYVGTGWLPVDPTFGQIGVDATHLKLVDGESTKELLPLVKLIGKLRITVLDYQYF